MVDISLYRCRIGLFSQKSRKRKFLYRDFNCDRKNCIEKQAFSCCGAIFKICLLLAFLAVSPDPPLSQSLSTSNLTIYSIPQLISDGQMMATPALFSLVIFSQPQLISDGQMLRSCTQTVIPTAQIQLQYQTRGKKLSSNFLAKYRNGNRSKKGIHNMHLNIRSLSNKMSEVKNLLKEHNPHIFGISECELRKIQGIYDEYSRD